MKLAPFFLATMSVFAQIQTGTATTSGACSPAASGNNNVFTINCGIGEAQGQKMVDILNKILANQLDPTEVMKKLDEILHAINPNLPTKVYFCDGEWRTQGPSATAALDISTGGDAKAFQMMVELYNSRKFPELLQDCLAQIQSTPEWLTPRLLCGLAYLGLGDRDRAATMLKEFDTRTGPAYDTDGCKQMSDFLHQQLR